MRCVDYILQDLIIPKKICNSAAHLVQDFVERLHNSSRRFVPILDPGIPVLPGYRPYDEGIEREIFIRDVTGQPYIGEVSLLWQALHV